LGVDGHDHSKIHLLADEDAAAARGFVQNGAVSSDLSGPAARHLDPKWALQQFQSVESELVLGEGTKELEMSLKRVSVAGSSNRDLLFGREPPWPRSVRR
jgi:hypothetical protein